MHSSRTTSTSAPETRQSESALRSLEDARLLIESIAHYAIFMLDPRGHVTSWNKGAQTITGYDAEEIIGQHFSKLYLPEDIASGKPERELALASEFGRTEDEGFRLRKDGSRFWANVVITAVRDELGNLRGYGKVARDLTQRRSNEERLRAAEERLHQLIDAVTDYAIFMLDAAGHVSTWNVGAYRTKGYEAAEIIGQHFSVFYTPEDRASGKPERVLETVQREGRYEEEGWRVRKDGSRFWADVVITPLRDGHGNLLGFTKVTRDLTARREAEIVERNLLREQAARLAAEQGERQLRESEERYRALSKRLEVILEGVAEGITVQDRSGLVIFANSAAARVCGFGSANELLQAASEDIIARFEILDERGQPFRPDDLPGRRALRGEPAGAAMLHVRERATGRHWWSLVRANVVLGADGQPELAVNIWHDVTGERRRAEHAKYLGNATAAFAETLNHDQMLSTLAGVLVPALADFCSIYLLENDQLRAVAVACGDSSNAADARRYFEEYPPERGALRGPANVIRTGRSEVYNHIADELLVDRARNSAELDALRKIGMSAALVAPIRVHERTTGTMVLVSTNSERQYDEHDVALIEELGRRAGIAVENARLFANERRARREAAEAARRAEEANRVKDEFLATVSHELRTPLNAILGWSTVLAGRQDWEPSLAKGIEVIHRNAQAQTRLIEDILDVSRIITGKLRLDLKPMSLVEVVSEAIEVIRPSAIAKRLEVQFSADEELPVAVGDPERLRQVVWNLLSNAVKFTEAGGRIIVRAEQVGSRLSVSVRDTGRGIDPQFLPHVFERFQQADSSTTRRYGGLGLGLAIVRHIVELHGGHVYAESQGNGSGALFRFTVPIRAVLAEDTDEEVPARPRVEHSARLPPDSLKDLRVLVVDDDIDARELLKDVLVRAGAVVETADSAPRGLEVLEAFRPHVLVSDIGMPEEDGYSFMRRVRSSASEGASGLPSIALTAYTRNEDRTKALAAGFTTHVGKPVNPDDLVAAVANLASLSRR